MPSSEGDRDYFDAHAARLRREALVDKWAAVAPLLDGLSPCHVIECGAGTGLYTLPLLAAGHRVTAVDPSPASLSQLRDAAAAVGLDERLKTVTSGFMEAVDDLPMADVVTFIKVLHHLPDRSTIAEALRRGWELIPVGGRLIIFEPNGSSPMWPLIYSLRGRERWAAERNLLLIRRRFLLDVLEPLDGARVTSGYRYLIPGALATRSGFFERLDRALTTLPLRYLAGNLWLSASRTA